MPRPESLGRVELDVLRLVAQHHPLSVREAAEKLADTSGQARTTVLTVLERLRKKGYLTRRKSGGVNRYSPRVAMPTLVQSLIGDFVTGVLGGSVSPFVAYLGKQSQLAPEELDELKRLVRELEAREAAARGPGAMGPAKPPARRGDA
jgi:predicted transcriptional regulator